MQPQQIQRQVLFQMFGDAGLREYEWLVSANQLDAQLKASQAQVQDLMNQLAEAKAPDAAPADAKPASADDAAALPAADEAKTPEPAPTRTGLP